MFKLSIQFCFFILLLASKANGQTNLVVNPSFEIHTACPDGTGMELNKASGWDSCRASPDYFNVCATINQLQVPLNYFGFQHAAHGNAYGGLYTYSSSSFYREIMIGQLVAPLVISQKYFISFKVNRADSNYVIGYSTNNLGIRFSTNKQNNVPISNWAHYNYTSVISDTLNWTRITGSFISDSSYSFIMLGNFFDDMNTIIINDQFAGVIGYYYIDEICVSTDSVFTQNYFTNVQNIVPQQDHILYPNPTTDGCLFISNHSSINNIQLFDVLGQRIEIINYNSGQMHLENLNNGVYLLILNNQERKKIIINKP